MVGVARKKGGLGERKLRRTLRRIFAFIARREKTTQSGICRDGKFVVPALAGTTNCYQELLLEGRSAYVVLGWFFPVGRFFGRFVLSLSLGLTLSFRALRLHCENDYCALEARFVSMRKGRPALRSNHNEKSSSESAPTTADTLALRYATDGKPAVKAGAAVMGDLTLRYATDGKPAVKAGAAVMGDLTLRYATDGTPLYMEMATCR